jgi:glycosyltransferase involved in cell wall biosynthesis
MRIRGQMKSIYFWGGPHPINESYISSPPDGIRIKSNLSSPNFFKVGEYTQRHTVLKTIATSGLKTLGLPRMAWIKTDCDAIHTNGGVIPLSNHPYFVTIEHASSFFHLDDDLFESDRWKKTLISFLQKKRCKKILPYSEATRSALEYGLGKYYEKIREKVEVLYPAIDAKIHFKKYPRIKNRESFHILFVSRHFFDDGGRELVEACKILSLKYDISVDIITNPPPHHQQLFEEYKKKINSDVVKIQTSSIAREILFRDYYSQSDLFVLPSYIHFFGYVMLEAMLYQLPVITSDVYAMPEIIKDGLNGFVVSSPISCFSKENLKPSSKIKSYKNEIIKRDLTPVTNTLVMKIEELISNPKMCEKMGDESFHMVTKGKFSTEYRNHQLKSIYELIE